MRKPTEKEISDFTTYRANHVALVQKLGQVALNKNFSDHDSDKINAVGKELDLLTLRNVSKKNEKGFSPEDLNVLRKVSAKHAKTQKHHAERWDSSITIKNFKADDTNVIHASKMPKKYIAEMACDWAACALYHNEPIFGWYNNVIDDTLLLTDSQKEYLKTCLILIKRAIKKYDIQFPGVKYDCEQIEPKGKLKEYKIGDRVQAFKSANKGTVVDLGWSPDEINIRTLKVQWDDKKEPEDVYDFMLSPLKEDGACNSSGPFSAMAPEKMHLIKTVLPEDDPFTSNELLTESKDHLIDKLNLTDEQKEELKSFFKKHPNYESKINWNNKNLTFTDFEEILALEGNTESSIKKHGLSGEAEFEDLIEDEDYKIVDKGKDWIIYYPLTFKASEVLARPSTPPLGITGKWCTSGRNYSPGTRDEHWNKYADKGIDFFFVFINSEDEQSKTAVARSKKLNKCEIFESDDTKIDKLPSVLSENVLYSYPPFLAEVRAKEREELRKKIESLQGIKGSSGGFVFYDKGYYSKGWRYLEAALKDLPGNFSWGSKGKFGTKEGIGEGKKNTEIIASQVGNAISNNAAIACKNYEYNGFKDWFLPSKDELDLMRTNLHKFNWGDFGDYKYWSSSEHDWYTIAAWFQYFSSGSQLCSFRYYDCRVRPVRAF